MIGSLRRLEVPLVESLLDGRLQRVFHLKYEEDKEEIRFAAAIESKAGISGLPGGYGGALWADGRVGN